VGPLSIARLSAERLNPAWMVETGGDYSDRPVFTFLEGRVMVAMRQRPQPHNGGQQNDANG